MTHSWMSRILRRKAARKCILENRRLLLLRPVLRILARTVSPTKTNCEQCVALVKPPYSASLCPVPGLRRSTAQNAGWAPLPILHLGRGALPSLHMEHSHGATHYPVKKVFLVRRAQNKAPITRTRDNGARNQLRF